MQSLTTFCSIEERNIKLKRMTLIGTTAAFLLALIALVGARAELAHAATISQFSASDLSGNCAFRLIANTGQTAVLVGTIGFDGSGNVSGSVLQNATGGMGGSTFAQFTGTYTANSDGTGTISFSSGGTTYDIAYAANAGPGLLQWILYDTGTPGIGQCSF
jgi:hypothetical protein